MAPLTRDVEMEDDTKAKPAKINLFPTMAEPVPKFVAPPANEVDMTCTFDEKNSTQTRILKFLARWPPSRTSFDYGPYIIANRGGQPQVDTPPDLEGLTRDFEALVAAETVTVETLDQISKANNVVVGKWMVFAESPKVDILWGKILHWVCTERKKGLAKVSTWKQDEKHVICVYVDDYTNKEEVNELRAALKKLGAKGKIGFKTDAYTHLNIYKQNPWNIRPSRYIR